MKLFDEEERTIPEENQNSQAYNHEPDSVFEVDYEAAIARAIEAEPVPEVDYAAAVARAIETGPVFETEYTAPIPTDRVARPARSMRPRGRRGRRRWPRRAVVAALIVFLAVLGGFFLLVRSPADRDAFTVLIAGQDNVGNHGLTDTLMLVRVDSGDGSVNIVSIPRDTRADVSWQGPKINSVFAMTGGSVERLMEEVEKLVGFMPDFYAVLNLQAFVELVDIVGGVEIDVPIPMQYSDPYDDPPLHINLEPGRQRLTGQQAMHFVRYRTTTGDLGRVQHQQQFLQAMAQETLRARNMARLPALAGVFGEHADTNLPLSGLAYMARRMVGAGDGLDTHTMPTEPFGPDLVPVLEPWLELINNYLNPHSAPVTLEHLRLYTRINGTIQLAGNGLPLTDGR